MNHPQELWWRQARSDLEIFDHLLLSGADGCHLLHYLQMATEKLSKAYLWRSGHAPPKAHTGFLRFLKALLDREDELDQIASQLGFRRGSDLENWGRNVRPLARALQDIAPAEARDGPNPEYPWPHDSPVHCPVGHPFDLWNRLTDTGQGRKLIDVVRRAVGRFDQYA